MRVAIDYSLASRHIGGMGVYVRNLAAKLKKIDNKNTYILIKSKFDFQNTKSIQKIVTISKEHIWYQFGLTKKLKDVDLIYFPNPPATILTSIPFVLTIPDMSFYFDKNINILTKFYLYTSYYLSAHKAKLITTFSEYSKRDISSILKVDSQKIHVIPLAVSKEFEKNIDKKTYTKTLKNLNITKPFILSTPGSFLPRKNIKDLIKAFNVLPKHIKNELQIVLVGNCRGKNYEKLQKIIKKNNVETSVIFTGYIETKKVASLCKGAKIFVYPSLYEGFGLPPLEAMQCSTPTIIYNKTSLPEVVGNAAIKVDNYRQLAKAIQKLILNPKLQKTLKEKGLKRAKNYSWEKTANLFKGLLEKTYHESIENK